jgi:signal transduction histidine kinase
MWSSHRPKWMLTTIVAIALLPALAALATGCGSPGDDQAATTQAGASTTLAPTKADVQAFVEKAVSFAKANGKEAALAAFTQAGGEFHQGQLYIYAYSFDGTVIAHGGDAKLVGQNLIGMKDPNGVQVIRELVALAQRGSGWLYYTWPNPANNNQQEPKLGYVMKVDDTWFLGSGTYGPAAIKP